MEEKLKIALAQVAPVWLQKKATLMKAEKYVLEAARAECELIVFGEGFVPGYPFWLAHTGGAQFESNVQKDLYAHYLRNAIQPEAGDLKTLCHLAKKNRIAIYLGAIERAANRGGHSLYCSLVYIDLKGKIQSVHRKLQPTYEERLVWSAGDGNGLVVHTLKPFTLGGLNCWENWMPMTRAVLQTQGENLHIATWPGNLSNTEDITRHMAKEGRSYSVAVSSLMRKSDIPKETPHYQMLMQSLPEMMADGGSCVAAPDGSWLVPPVTQKEGLITTTLILEEVFRARQNFDPAGHYARPDVIQLQVNRERQHLLTWKDEVRKG